MTAAETAILDGLALEIKNLQTSIASKTARRDLLQSSFDSGNFQPFGLYTTAEENSAKPALYNELQSLYNQLPHLQNQLTAKVKEFADAKNLIISKAEQDAIEAQAIAQANVQTAQANAVIADTQTKIETAKNKLYVAKSTNYLIIGAVVVAVGLIIYAVKKSFS